MIHFVNRVPRCHLERKDKEIWKVHCFFLYGILDLKISLKVKFFVLPEMKRKKKNYVTTRAILFKREFREQTFIFIISTEKAGRSSDVKCT